MRVANNLLLQHRFKNVMYITVPAHAAPPLRAAEQARGLYGPSTRAARVAQQKERRKEAVRAVEEARRLSPHSLHRIKRLNSRI